MSVSYMSDMSRMANEYRSLIVQANMLHEKGDNASIRREAECYKRAAELTENLANLSVGKEYEYWIERQQEVSRRFNEISEYALRRARQMNGNGDSSASSPQGKQVEGTGTKAQKPKKEAAMKFLRKLLTNGQQTRLRKDLKRLPEWKSLSKSFVAVYAMWLQQSSISTWV